MKPRTVLVTLEIVTDEPLEALRTKGYWNQWLDGVFHAPETFDVRQVTASVQQQPETKGRGKRP